MSYRFNKDKRNSKNSSFDSRSNNYYRQDNDSKKSNFNDRRRTNNRINRLSSDQVNNYSLEKESLERSRSSYKSNSNAGGSNRFERKSTNPSYRDQNTQENRNYRGSNRFERKSPNPSYRNQNLQGTHNHRSLENKEPLSYSESFTKTLSDDLIWGRHSTEAALLAGRAIHRIWCTSELPVSYTHLTLPTKA